MITVELTDYEYRVIRSALETEYYHAKDEMNDTRMHAILEIETKLAKAHKEDD